MNCAKCSYPTSKHIVTNRPAKAPKLEKIGELDDHNKMRCPVCRAIFFFPKSERQLV